MINQGFKTITSTMNVGLADYFMPIAGINSFCSRILNRGNSGFNNDGYFDRVSLIYNLPQNEDEEQSTNSDVVVNLLLQLRAFNDEQNSLFNNKNVIQQQIWNQIERKLVFINDNKAKVQIKKLKENFSKKLSNNKDFNNAIESIANNLKKKS